MNKWNLICPVTLLLIVGLGFGIVFTRKQTASFNMAVESRLQSVVDVLAEHQETGRFPSLDSARAVLTKSNLDTDLFYNPRQPAIGSDSVVLGAQIGGRWFAIRANRTVFQITEDDFTRAELVKVGAVPSERNHADKPLAN